MFLRKILYDSKILLLVANSASQFFCEANFKILISILPAWKHIVGHCQQDKLAQPRPQRNRMTRELQHTDFENRSESCASLYSTWTRSVAVPVWKEIGRRQLAFYQTQLLFQQDLCGYMQTIAVNAMLVNPGSYQNYQDGAMKVISCRTLGEYRAGGDSVSAYDSQCGVHSTLCMPQSKSVST